MTTTKRLRFGGAECNDNHLSEGDEEMRVNSAENGEGDERECHRGWEEGGGNGRESLLEEAEQLEGRGRSRNKGGLNNGEAKDDDTNDNDAKDGEDSSRNVNKKSFPLAVEFSDARGENEEDIDDELVAGQGFDLSEDGAKMEVSSSGETEKANPVEQTDATPKVSSSKKMSVNKGSVLETSL